MDKRESFFEISDTDEVVSLIMPSALTESLCNLLAAYIRFKQPKPDEKIQVSFRGKLTVVDRGLI